MNEGIRKEQKKIIQWIMLIACIVFIVYFFSTKKEDFRLLLDIRPQRIVLLAILCMVYLILHGYRYKIVLEKCSKRFLAFLPWFKIFIIGRFLNTIIPQGGNVYRSVLLKKNHGITFTHYVSGFFSFAWMDTCFNLLIALVVVGIINPDLYIGPLRALHLITGLVALLVGFPMFLKTVFQSFTIQHRFLSRVHLHLSEMLTISVQNFCDGCYMIRFFLVGLLVFLQACMIFYVCFLSMGLRIGVAEVVFFYVFLKLSTHISITPGNVGIQEIGFGIISHQLQMSVAQGMLVSVILRMVSYVALLGLALPMGGIDLLRHSERYRNRGDKG